MRPRSGGQHREKPERFFLERYRESYVTEMQEFVECVRAGRMPSADGQDGLQAVLLAQAAQLSSERKRPVCIDESSVRVDAA